MLMFILCVCIVCSAVYSCHAVACKHVCFGLVLSLFYVCKQPLKSNCNNHVYNHIIILITLLICVSGLDLNHCHVSHVVHNKYLVCHTYCHTPNKLNLFIDFN